jgi:hypothetical protein
MGTQRLRDLIRPSIFTRSSSPTCPRASPALMTLDSLPNNLALQLTSFIGREKEIAEIKEIDFRASGLFE